MSSSPSKDHRRYDHRISSEGKIVEFIRASELEERPKELDPKHEWTDSSALVRFTLSDDKDAEIHTTYILDFAGTMTWPGIPTSTSTLGSTRPHRGMGGSIAPDGWFFLKVKQTLMINIPYWPIILAVTNYQTLVADFWFSRVTPMSCRLRPRKR